MKIVSLTASNIKRLTAVEITPDGSTVVITGKNGAGKSSVLDAIEYALAGKSSQCPQPVRKGAKRAEVVCDLGDLIVRRTFTRDGGGSLIVELPNSERVSSPQRILDKLVGKLTFDPLRFSRMPGAAQAEELRSLVGLDTEELDDERTQLYGHRAIVNRDLRSAKARLEAAPGPHKDAPKEETPAADVLEEIKIAEDENAIRDSKLRARDYLLIQLTAAETAVATASNALADAKRAVKAAEQGRKLAAKTVETQKAEILKVCPESTDVQPFRDKLAGLEDLNRQVRQNTARKELAKGVIDLDRKARKLTQAIDGIDEKKAEQLEAAEFPVTGLLFDEDGMVTYNGLPFEQASHAEQLRVSVAMGLAANPTLRVLLIRDGSLLDEDGMIIVSKMAENADAQLWIERVEADQPGAVVIEDGADRKSVV